MPKTRRRTRPTQGARVTRSQTAVATNPGSGQHGDGSSVNVGAQPEMATVVTNPVQSQGDMNVVASAQAREDIAGGSSANAQPEV